MNINSAEKLKKASLIIVSLIVVLSGFVTSSLQAKGSAQPNVLLILVDDLGGRDIEPTGSSVYQTPNLNQFAKESSLYENSYAVSPICSPSRAAIMTGKFPARLGINDWIPGWGDKRKPLQTPKVLDNLELEEVTSAEHFKKAGYRTMFAGKWHLGGEGYWPNAQGFDVNKGGHHKGGPPGGYHSPYKNPVLSDGPEGEYLTYRLAQEVVDFTTQKSNKPFFAMLSFYTVHTPIQAAEDHLGKYRHLKQATEFGKEGKSDVSLQQDNPVFASMVSGMDQAVGQVINALKASGQYDNTLIVFTSDNGGLATGKGKKKAIPTSNFPYRAGKSFLYEGGIRVPLMIKYPDQKQPTVEQQFTTTMDVFATMVATVNNNEVDYFDGINLAKLKGKAEERPLYFHYPHYHRQGWQPGGAIRVGDWKLVEDFETGDTQLYNLAGDISEKQDLSKKQPEKAKQLLARLQKWRAEVNAPMPVKR